MALVEGKREVAKPLCSSRWSGSAGIIPISLISRLQQEQRRKGGERPRSKSVPGGGKLLAS